MATRLHLPIPRSNNAGMSGKKWFVRLAEKTAALAGTSRVFLLALAVVIIWACTGPFFRYSDTWQLVINTATTVITFLMVFLIQNTQNRDARALQIKLDELIRATQTAHTGLLDLEEMSETELNLIRDKYLAMAREAHRRMHDGQSDMDIPEITLES